MPSALAETFRLYLVRHARAGWGTPGLSDFDRPLDETGRFEAREIAERAVLAGMVPDVLISSPALRCKQTTAALTAVFRAVRPVEDMALYSGGPDAYFAQIRDHAHHRSVMIVGHNPMIEAVAHHVAQPSEILAPLAIGYPTAGFLAIDLANPLPERFERAGQAVALITPALT